MKGRLEQEIEEAEKKAWKALASYKFHMFGYWAAHWVFINSVGQFHRRSPFKELVKLAKRTLVVEGWK